ncbi:MAG: hypothetical protein ACYTGX_03275 [Planctomycetota bacterium]|jgi:tetratricopeptide (TPR) repeat protein
MRLTFGAGGLVGLCLAAGCGSAAIADGDAAMASKDYAAAVGHYRTAKADGEAGADFEAKLGEAQRLAAEAATAEARGHEQAGRWTKAVEAWESARRFNPTDQALITQAQGATGRAAAALAERAAAARRSGDLAGAAESLRRAVEWDDAEPVHRTALAAVLVEMGKAAAGGRDVAGAIAAYGEAATLDPENRDAADGLALQTETRGRVEAAVQAARDAQAKKDLDEALKQLDAALVLWPAHAPASALRAAIATDKQFLDHLRQGTADLNQQRWDAAITAFNAAAALRQNDLLTERRNTAYRGKWTAEGEAAAAAGDWPKAVEAYEQARRYAADGSAEFDDLAKRIRRAHYERLMVEGRRLEADRKWVAAAKIYAQVKAQYADAVDDALNRRIIAVEEYIARIQCELCQGTKLEPVIDLESGKTVGEKTCTRCDGTGQELKLKAR